MADYPYAKKLINGKWYQLLLGFFILAGLVFLVIWGFMESFDLPKNEGFLKNLFIKRWGSHLLLTFFITPYLTMLIILGNRMFGKKQTSAPALVNPNTGGVGTVKHIFNGSWITGFDFEGKEERNWHIASKKRIGILREVASI